MTRFIYEENFGDGTLECIDIEMSDFFASMRGKLVEKVRSPSTPFRTTDRAALRSG
jgi:hypothetical protein